MSVTVFDLAKGVQGYYIKNERFNTTLLSYNFYIPLNKEDMATNSLLVYLLTSCSEKYRDYIGLNLRLLELYGADLSCSATKCGDCFHIKVAVSVINNNLSFDETCPVNEAAELITDLLFAPATENGSFYSSDIEREKRKTVERIEGEINNKRAFARTRLLEEMFGADPYGKFSFGTVEEVQKISGEELYCAWKNMLKTAFIRINVVGKELPEGIFAQAENLFKQIERKDITDISRFVKIPEAKEVKTVTQRMNITQGKLAMGFTSELHGNLSKAAPLSLFCDIFGGGPYSKLFENVREKQSLCYYCTASSRRSKGFVTVESGVEEVNADKTVESVMKELADMQNGNFSDSVIEASKKSVIDSLNSYNDNASALDIWYSRDLGDLSSPSEAAEIVRNVKKEQIVSAAKGVKLHTVYKLLPKGDKE